MLKADGKLKERTPITEVNELLKKLSTVYVNLLPGESRNSFKDKYLTKMFLAESPFSEILSGLNDDLQPQNGDMFSKVPAKIALLTISTWYCISAIKAYKAGAINQAWAYATDAQLWVSVILARQVGQINSYGESKVLTTLSGAEKNELIVEEVDEVPSIAYVVIPKLPHLVSEILDESESQLNDPRDIIKLIESDHDISSEVLKVINSPFYIMSEHVKTVSRAADLVGYKKINLLVICAALRKAIADDKHSVELDLLWQHSHHSALVLAYLATFISGIDKNTAYLFGMFHDAGKALMTKQYPDYSKALRLMVATPDLGLIDIESSLYSYDHAQLGAMLAEEWRLPADIIHGIRIHHHANNFTNSLVSDNTKSLIALADLAEYIESGETGYSDNEWLKNKDKYMAHLSITDHQLEEMIIEARAILAK